MNSETQRWLEEVRARVNAASPSLVSTTMQDFPRLLALITEQAGEIERLQQLGDAISLEKYGLVIEIESLRSEKEQLKARNRTAQRRLDGGNDCFDSLEEVVEAAVQHRGAMRSAANRAVEGVKRKRD